MTATRDKRVTAAATVSTATAIGLLVWMGVDTARGTAPAMSDRERMLAQQLVRERAAARERVRVAYRVGVRHGRVRAVRAVARDPNVTEAISLAAHTFGVDRRLLERLAFCESRMNPHAKNRSSSASGLFQFIDTTWAGNRYGRAGFSVWSPYANAMGAAYHISRYGTGAWECA